ncbi:nuclear transport factor 2 family protein [Goodfellowiella coeruleoviolacea]|uniref:Ketosteroid isomerase-related protein n=1 Tax=Goodfellowiella coeruleoviolacea TaxID=334858 RepID=A0AAE3GH46_9PSEU|nr:nuclear transport factor 2 family protein [Goodfellowiella coeruleoviolacea]MCP2167174.1 Ketosteroid isomerase-related protein [Goodfellowiella coeruleoviolacea]
MSDAHPDTPTPAAPREVVERFLRASARNEWDELADLYAEDAVIEIAFAPPGVPARWTGREVHRARFKTVSDLWRFERADSVVIHETSDPEVVIVECDLHGRTTREARPFTFSYIMVMRIRDGLIVFSKDYHDPLAGARALGTAAEPGVEQTSA